VCVGEIAEVAGSDEAAGQHMLAEAAQERARGEGHDALLVAVRIVFSSEAYAATVEDWEKEGIPGMNLARAAWIETAGGTRIIMRRRSMSLILSSDTSARRMPCSRA
jgi:hypothetical protein